MKIWKVEKYDWGKIPSLVCSNFGLNAGGDQHVNVDKCENMTGEKYRLWSVATLGVPGSMSRRRFSSRDRLSLLNISVGPVKSLSILLCNHFTNK